MKLIDIFRQRFIKQMIQDNLKCVTKIRRMNIRDCLHLQEPISPGCQNLFQTHEGKYYNTIVYVNHTYKIISIQYDNKDNLYKCYEIPIDSIQNTF